MDDIFKKLYDLHLITSATPFGQVDKETLDEEWRLYHFLYENLSKENKQAFSEYTNLRETRQNEETKAAYIYGFKTAIQLIIESLKE